jgi:hypothetical protein
MAEQDKNETVRDLAQLALTKLGAEPPSLAN